LRGDRLIVKSSYPSDPLSSAHTPSLKGQALVFRPFSSRVDALIHWASQMGKGEPIGAWVRSSHPCVSSRDRAKFLCQDGDYLQHSWDSSFISSVHYTSFGVQDPTEFRGQGIE
jgi:hypothetical protein